MLEYLDNAENSVDTSHVSLSEYISAAALGAPPQIGARTGINENYARELLELHTLGVDGGYTQADVAEVARVLTGWSVAPAPRGGGFEVPDWAHDAGGKTVMGTAFPAAHGADAGMRLLRMLASHPSTMHFVSGKLCARFVADPP